MKKILFAILAILCLAASWWMKKNAKGHLTELKDFWWVPLPLAGILLLILFKQDKPKQS